MPLIALEEHFLDPELIAHFKMPASHAMRFVLSGHFDECPGLQIILGHFGEAIPFLLTRIDEALSRDTPMTNFRNVFTKHFHVTTSGFFSDNALRLCIDELGADRVLFSVDWPYASNAAASAWICKAPLTAAERAQANIGMPAVCLASAKPARSDDRCPRSLY